jgi:sulfatase maturation enzyme AslB (radical SAM superfamily)
MRFPAKWPQLLRNIEKLKGKKFRDLDLHQHTVITATNWQKLGEIIRFFSRTFPMSFNIIPIFVEIDTPGVLHPRVLPENQWEQGKKEALRAISELAPKNEAQLLQVENFKNLVQKMELKNHQDMYVDYQIFLQKVKAHRKERQPHGA